MMSNKYLIYIAGPTAIGKTALSIKLAKYFNTEIISCDSRQFYKEMSIGTGAPSKSIQKNIKHHFLQHKSVSEFYSAGDFGRDCLDLLKKLFKKNDKIIMVGGSGLYAKAVTSGLDKFPKVNQKVKEKINEYFIKDGLQGLQKMLLEKDPIYFERVDLNNHRRIIRALEICEESQKPYSSFLNLSSKTKFFETKTIFLELPRDQLYKKINKRVDEMIKKGFKNEAKKLYPNKDLRALQTLGYKEWFNHFDGKIKSKKTIEKKKKNTRRYAKRQLTWFNKIEKVVIELENDEIPTKKIVAILNNLLT